MECIDVPTEECEEVEDRECNMAEVESCQFVPSMECSDVNNQVAGLHKVYFSDIGRSEHSDLPCWEH